MKRRHLVSLLLTAVLPLTFVQSAGAFTNTSTRTMYVKQEIQNANSFYTDLTLKNAKYADMEASPFAFYRATNHLYYADLDTGVIPVPSQWKTTSNVQTWLSGDFHTQNVGFLDNDNGKVVFDLNDFDESYIGPFYWDLLRYTTSLFLMKPELGTSLSDSDIRDVASTFLSTYQTTLSSVNGNSNEKDLYLDKAALTGFMDDQIASVQSKYSTSTLLSKWTSLQNGVRRFNFANPDLGVPTATDRAEVGSYFGIKDQAVRLNSGLGSQGVKKYYLLVEGPTSSQDDDVILEVKEERLPSLFHVHTVSQSLYTSQFSNHGTRTSTANKALLNHVDNYAGSLQSATRTYYVHRISPWKKGFDPADFKSKSDLTEFAKASAQALAYAHARSDRDYNSTYVSYNFEDGALQAIALWPQFKTTVSQLAENYAAQVQADYNSFVGLVNSGQLP
ncbi:DUF2252 family protein [Tumebacillus sp. ITR2]|uniref:DUF2252 family protein n=1 Tax=Tumebacillus amylolyticus TaxID=2801339 RepID=A0ABS1J741_9BACL|nr:DUF2252 family protein [Tumebacillus amylolyticus]MBL0386087.1 DUF2252 family protein [Tumebacillus amylolyticus]